MAGDHDELLPLGVVPVLALGDAGLGDVDAHLAAVQRVDQFRERAALVDVHLQVEYGLVFWQVRQERAVQTLGERISRDFGNQQRLGLVGKFMEQVHYFTKSSLVGDGAIAVATLCRRYHVKTLKLAMVLPTLQGVNHLVDKVVDVE